MLMAFSLSLSAQVPEGYSSVTDVENLKNKIRETSTETWSISSDFVQEKHLTMMEEVLVSHGRFLFKKENNVKWEYVDPITYAIVIHGNSFVINNDGKISKFDTESNKLFEEINSMIVMAIQGDFVDNPDFSASFFENDKNFLAVLLPKNELLKNILTGINISFLKSDMSVKTVKFVEPGEDFTKIIFSNRKANIDIPNSQFEAGND